MGITERRRAVHDVLGAYAASDEPRLRELLTDDVRWWVPPSAAGRYPRPIVGVDAVVAVLAGPSLAYRKPTIAWTVHHVVVGRDDDDGDAGGCTEGDTDVVMASASMTATLINGNAYANDYAYVFRFVGDRIAEATEYADTAHARDQASAARE
jgi:uncharacterized protein